MRFLKSFFKTKTISKELLDDILIELSDNGYVYGIKGEVLFVYKNENYAKHYNIDEDYKLITLIGDIQTSLKKRGIDSKLMTTSQIFKDDPLSLSQTIMREVHEDKYGSCLWIRLFAKII